MLADFPGLQDLAIRAISAQLITFHVIGILARMVHRLLLPLVAALRPLLRLVVYIRNDRPDGT